MTDPIHIDPEVMRTVANQHDDVADQIAPAREASTEILAAVNTFGPIMHQFKSAVSDLMVNRDAALSNYPVAELRPTALAQLKMRSFRLDALQLLRTPHALFEAPSARLAAPKSKAAP